MYLKLFASQTAVIVSPSVPTVYVAPGPKIVGDVPIVKPLRINPVLVNSEVVARVIVWPIVPDSLARVSVPPFRLYGNW